MVPSLLLSSPFLCVTRRNVTIRNANWHLLTDLQQAVLESIWLKGRATAEEVREALKPRHPLKDSSVRTVLRRLEARGYVSHRVEGRTFVYQADLPPQRLAALAVRQVIARFCSGSVEQFLVGMVDEEVLSTQQLKRLAQKTSAPAKRKSVRRRP